MVDDVTNLMINMYEIEKLGMDFMGYGFQKRSELSYHHLLTPTKMGGKKTMENGAILVRDTAHDYIHLVQRVNRAIFDKITREIIEEKNKGKIDIENIRRINELLEEFEFKYADESQKDGSFLIKEKYKIRILTQKF